MILHTPRSRPAAWLLRRQAARRAWLRPVIAIEWVWEWMAYALSRWAFLEVLEYLSSFSVLVAVIFYFSESGDRIKARHYQAWQVINTSQGKGGSGGRIDALQELNEDKVPLVGVDVSLASLQGLQLRHANLLRADFSSADLRNSSLADCDLTLANLNSANFRGADLQNAMLRDADLREADLNGATLANADLSGARLDGADLRFADLRGTQWQHIRSMQGAQIRGVRNAPEEFMDWAIHNGAVNEAPAEK
jgi:hypothetical protein